MLTVTDLHVAYGKIEAVRGVGLSVDQGKITLVLGANGAGKSTTLKAIAGMVPAQRGSVVLDGAEVLGQAPHRLVRRGLALVPEGRRVFGPLTVAENLRMGGYTAGKKVLEQTLDRVYDTFPILAERRNGAAGLLSGGEQQMLAFGRALMSQPKVMLMDEPSMGLAPVVVDSILAGVRQMADDGIGILMVEQNAEAGLDLADDVVAVARGEVVYTGASGDARNHASVLRAFLGEAALAGKGA
ncbi:ABC transporter ATP-binding protein [Geodermatophilus aquaeductus]|uniref:Amino acid/amide ABC transporter ATP-binding protein 2, HAAT family n=1 Tax=Geodermatophilus aquaeductus TaxID=1564161 RepID=A0A521FGE3_9ACTN|nr:ABC transporter ATP-binding protein [Geodermatophilus aquaeductus]SMO94620.1 amino acid/amide ABC transporter ATP-binding protein 2, HAAT family [Geodermatophilus aquaeductus]